MVNDNLKSCQVCRGTGSEYLPYNLGLPAGCIACQGTGKVTEEFWKEQIIQFAENNLVALELITDQENDKE
ncbi:MAG: hypothetical protein V3U54_08535 [Thermodesulfobacteriota bacterium]